MVKIRQTDDPVPHRRGSPSDIQRTENNPNRHNVPRQNSAKATSASSDCNQPLIKMTSSDAPSEKRHGPKQKKRSRKHEPQDFTEEELMNHKERIISTRLNKELFRNMKNSILSLNALTSGLTEQVAQVREQQKHAKNLWNDLENQLLRVNTALKEDNDGRRTDPRHHRSDSPEKLVLPNIDSTARNDVGRQNSLPSVFRDVYSPSQNDSEVFNSSQTNHIKKVARKKSQDNSTRPENLFPMVTNDLGMPRLQLISKKLDDVPKKASFCTDKDVRNKIEKRLLALRAFQEKFIIEPKKGSSSSEKCGLNRVTSGNQTKHTQKDKK